MVDAAATSEADTISALARTYAKLLVTVVQNSAQGMPAGGPDSAPGSASSSVGGGSNSIGGARGGVSWRSFPGLLMDPSAVAAYCKLSAAAAEFAREVAAAAAAAAGAEAPASGVLKDSEAAGDGSGAQQNGESKEHGDSPSRGQGARRGQAGDGLGATDLGGCCPRPPRLHQCQARPLHPRVRPPRGGADPLAVSGARAPGALLPWGLLR